MELKRKPLPKRAKIGDQVIPLLIATARVKVANLKIQTDYWNADRRQRYFKANRATLTRLASMASGDTTMGSALDKELALFFSAPYAEFGITENTNGSVFFTGMTCPITMRETTQSDQGRGENGAKWDIGRYLVAIPVGDLERAQIPAFQLVPVRAPFTAARHPHHTIKTPRDGVVPIVVSPLDHEVYSCTATWAGILGALGADLSVAELFKQLHGFLSLYNTSSPLARPERNSEMDFMKREAA